MFRILPDTNPMDYSFSTISQVINSLIHIILQLGGAAAVVMIIYGGFLYITSFGNDTKVEQGKKILTWSIVGLIIIMLAQLLVTFVACSFFGVEQGVCSFISK